MSQPGRCRSPNEASGSPIGPKSKLGRVKRLAPKDAPKFAQASSGRKTKGPRLPTTRRPGVRPASAPALRDLSESCDGPKEKLPRIARRVRKLGRGGFAGESCRSPGGVTSGSGGCHAGDGRFALPPDGLERQTRPAERLRPRRAEPRPSRPPTVPYSAPAIRPPRAFPSKASKQLSAPSAMSARVSSSPPPTWTHSNARTSTGLVELLTEEVAWAMPPLGT
jgi:hypothetical protein